MPRTMYGRIHDRMQRLIEENHPGMLANLLAKTL
jgi:hypothetical protein